MPRKQGDLKEIPSSFSGNGATGAVQQQQEQRQPATTPLKQQQQKQRRKPAPPPEPKPEAEGPTGKMAKDGLAFLATPDRFIFTRSE